MPSTPNPKVTIPGSGVLLHVLNTSNEPIPVKGNDDGAITTTGGGGGGGTTVDQGTGDAANPWAVQGVNAGVGERLATQADQTNGTQKTRITDGTNDATVMNSAPTGTEYGVGTRTIGDTATTNAAASQADGHSASIGSTADADTSSTVIGRLKKIASLLAGGLPAALGGGGGLKVDGSGTPLPVDGTVTANAGTGNFASTNAAGSQADGHSATVGATTDADTDSTVIGRLKKTVALLAGGLPAALGAGGGLKIDGSGTALPTSNAAASQADGHSASIGATTDASSASTVIGQLKKLVSLLPAALVSGRLDNNIGAWLGATTPTVGQKTMAASIPVSMASDQTAAKIKGEYASGSASQSDPVMIGFGTGAGNTIRALGTSDGGLLMAVRFSTSTLNLLGDSSGRVLIAGAAASGSAVAGNPVLVGGSDGTNARSFATDSGGRVSVFGNRISRSSHMASATLPAAGAFTSPTAYTIPEGQSGITAYVSYTRGAVGGQVVLQPKWGNGTETAQETGAVSNADSGGTVRQTISLFEILGPVVNTASAVVFKIEFVVPPGATTFTLPAAEVGVTGTPGTAAIALTGKYGA